MFVDKVKIFIKAGDGGNGCASFFTAKHVANGGPNGGDGGRGGSVVFVASEDRSTLIDFYYQRHFRAENGLKGEPALKTGKSGKDIVVTVPPGTLVFDTQGNLLCDLFHAGQQFIAQSGGAGGFGNNHFKNSRRQSPEFSQLGEKKEEIEIVLELKYIADLGIVGYPNAGKSSLLSLISDAKPKIGDYHFTTLSPNLGVVRYYENSFVAADIPGLIEGAAEGAGLGHEFLRHIERTRMLLHVVDISGIEGRDAVEDYRTVSAELKKYSKKLASLPKVIALNKADLLEPEVLKERVREFKAKVRGKKVLLISCAARQGIKELIAEVYGILSELPPPEPIRASEKTAVRLPAFTVECIDNGVFVVSGRLITNLGRNVLLSDPQSYAYLQRSLIKYGVIKALKAAGMTDGDTVKLLDTEFIYED